MILDVGNIEIVDDKSEGNRGRLVTFSKMVSKEGVGNCVKIFIDADHDRIQGISHESCVWMTDGRDLEGYILTEKSLEKMLSLGFGLESLDAENLLSIVSPWARKAAALRLLSERQKLNLPFQRTDLARYACVAKAPLSLDIEWPNYVRALLQNGSISLVNINSIIDQCNQVEIQLNTWCNRQLIHGKDAICLIGIILRKLGCPIQGIEPALWSSYETDSVAQNPNLDAALQFIC